MLPVGNNTFDSYLLTDDTDATAATATAVLNAAAMFFCYNIIILTNF